MIAPVHLDGDAFDRGRAQAQSTDADEVRRVTQLRLDEARAAGHLDAPGQHYLAAQFSFAQQHDPHGLAEVAGIAEGFGLTQDQVFAHLHLGVLQDIAKGAPVAHDGCSAWAVADGPDGPLVVKNRDFAGSHVAIQRVFRHDGPDLLHGPCLCIGSLGAPGAYSSGMNAAGLAVVDTQVGVQNHRVGWLRYFVMTRILAATATVADALEFLRAIPHAGGGTLVMADRGGHVACVELGSDAIAIEQAPVVCRTNHFTTTALAHQTMGHAESEIDASSLGRRVFLDRTLPRQGWNAADAMKLMGQHDASNGAAAVCQHVGATGTQTLSGAVFCCRTGVLYVCYGAPCTEPWHRIPLVR
ncbi:C45 family peptidase [uncultured Aliiroseovarius sp.]|uniref:C45 family autoproteolytic acyltransferase/hydolase n=1 Tax=uncultured Aliiroseovarius sp. TaxID=1658783 RepID=UPI0025941F4B|nr:C45 family peptidase [uncultured Aliiroseovarius sp.]